MLQAMREFGVTPEETAAIGDRLADVRAAWAAGIQRAFLFKPRSRLLGPVRGLLPVRMVAALPEAWEAVREDIPAVSETK